MATTQDVRQHRLNAQVLTESDDRFDLALARWFARHQGGWSGTASELIAAIKSSADAGNDLWSQPAGALRAHLESHRESLHDLGVDVLPHPGFPRLLCLRSCQEEKASGNPPSDKRATNHISDLPDNSHSSTDQKTVHVVSDLVSPVDHSAASPAMGLVESDPVERIANDKHTGRESSRNRAFEDTAEALFGIVEMRDRIREESLDLESTMHLVASRTQAITGSSGVVLGWLQQGTLVYPAQVGIAATMAGLPCQADLLLSCISQGTVLPLPDAQKDPVVGASCRRESIRSLLVAPIFLGRKGAGAMELLFSETRSFSSADVMILELIADLVSEQVAGVGKQAETQPTPRESRVHLRITENIEPLDEKRDADEPRTGYSQNASAGMPRPISAPASASRKRVWTRLP
jgi:GAF domain-containing protein